MANEKHPWQGYFIGVLLALYLVVGIIGSICIHLNCFDLFMKSSLLRSHFFCASFGFIGATIALIRKYYKIWITSGTDLSKEIQPPSMDWSFGWIYYFIIRPWLGGVLGALAYTLSFVGFQILSKSDEISMSGEGKILLFAVAFLTGYSVSDVLDRLSETSKQLFNKKEN